MLLLIYNVILLIFILSICFIATFTDIKYGKVFNKHVVFFILIGLFTNAIYFTLAFIYKEIEISTIIKVFINIIIALLVSYLFYYFKIWAAGDAKLYVLLLFLTPYNIIIENSLNIFPGFIILIFVFSISFIYVAIETLVFMFKDLVNGNLIAIKGKQSNLNKESVIDFAIKYLFSFFLTSIIAEILLHQFQEFFRSNRGLLILLNVFLVIVLLNLFKGKRIFFITIILGVLYIAIKTLLIPITEKSFYISLNSLLTIMIVMFFRYLGNKYNYKELPVQNVKEGMILSFDTVIQFQKSRINGLPIVTTETTDSRITSDHVESIKRWANSKLGNPTIKIVRHLPFAPFISIGTLAFIIIRIYIIMKG